MTVPLLSVLAGDAFAGYFVAARQFIWILPAAVVLAAGAIDRYKPPSVVLYALLGAVCIRQDVAFFTAPRENWDAAAAFLADQRQHGACVAVAPPESARLYAFFYPQLARETCQAPRMALAITPFTTNEQRQRGIASLTSQGYIRQEEVVVGKSTILFLAMRLSSACFFFKRNFYFRYGGPRDSRLRSHRNIRICGRTARARARL